MSNIFTIQPSAPFLDTLARGLLDQPSLDLADMLILLPSRRACLGLRDAFLRVGEGRPMLLPRMQPVGETDEEALLIGGAEALDLPRAIDPLRRQLLLARLVIAKGVGEFDQALRLAGELAALLDECATEEVPLALLTTIVPGHLAEHWQETLTFLSLLSEAWPEVIAAENAVDPAERRRLMLDRQGAIWATTPPAHPVLAAGMTGTVPAVARLLGVIARLPQGRIVLPGLDLAMDPATWAEVEAVHPQWGMKRLLERMDVAREAVLPWPVDATPAGPVARDLLLRETLRPAARTESWRGQPPPPAEALAGLEIAVAPDLATEATTIALRLRAALETPGKTAALVTPDRHLARRVAVELGRWGLVIDDSAGVPLDQTPPAGLMLLAAHAVAEDFAPGPLLALLKHPLTRGGDDQGRFRRRVRALERSLLRGPRPAGGLRGLGELLAEAEEDPNRKGPVPFKELKDWLAGVEAAAAPFAALMRVAEAPLTALVEAHLAFCAWLAADAEGSADELWAKAAGDALAAFVETLGQAADGIGVWATSAYPPLLAVLMAEVQVRPDRPGHPRLAILGRLESRLQRTDLVILGGLAEGVWPEAADPGPWLSRAMRAAMGLPSVEQRIGFAAHDFHHAACAGEVVLSRASKDRGGAPLTPSRFLARLEAVLRSVGRVDAVAAPTMWRDWAVALDAPERVVPTGRPQPCPPVRARPRELSATDIETLLRDPYAIYARRILRLRKLDPIDADPGGSERGQIIHEALQQFIVAYPATLPDSIDELLRIARASFDRHTHLPQVRAVWWPRFLEAATWLWGKEIEFRNPGVEVWAEKTGILKLPAPGGEVTLSGRADRLEFQDGKLIAIVDYKTGGVPSAKDMTIGRKPQLAVEATIARFGAFDGVRSASLARVEIWPLSGRHDVKVVSPKVAADQLADETRDHLIALLAFWDLPDSVYHAVPRPEIAPDYNDYEHLARTAEWRGGSGS